MVPFFHTLKPLHLCGITRPRLTQETVQNAKKNFNQQTRYAAPNHWSIYTTCACVKKQKNQVFLINLEVVVDLVFAVPLSLCVFALDRSSGRFRWEDIDIVARFVAANDLSTTL